MRWFPEAIATSLRYKVLALVLFPILLVMPAVLFLAVDWSDRLSYQQLYMKVNTDLSVAHDIFVRLRTNYQAKLKELGDSYRFRSDLTLRNREGMEQQIAQLRTEQPFEYLTLIDPDGHDMMRGTPAANLDSPLWREALSGRSASGVEIWQPEQLEALNSELAKRVRLTLLQTPRAKVIDRTVEDRAMMIRFFYPLKNNRGEVTAVLDSGIMLNGNFDFVDTIRDLVYGPGSLPEGGLGTVTVFLDDVRISTNVPIRPGERALGTRVSNEVRQQVLERGENWIDRAFVVNDWYISAYEPIYDVHGQRVGILYAGFLESPFRQAHLAALKDLIALFISVTIIAILVGFFAAKAIFRPIEKLTSVVRATQAGEARRIGEVPWQDELGELAVQFDTMLDLLQERNEQIQRAADELEQKVEDRTHELREKNVDLQNSIELLKRTREQLVNKEKLAALGELTAGIAHEINNPVAVMLGNIDIVMAEMGSQLDPVENELKLIIEQISRIRAIVQNLLQYSRPSAYVVSAKWIRSEEALEDTLVLVRHALDKNSIKVEKKYRATQKVKINLQQLQQVLVNLIVNAVNAMEKGGGLVLGTADWRQQGVVIYVKDTGVGISAEELEQVFDPFYTTRSQGTGLGLSVSYGILRRYGGRITVRSRPGRGSIFYVWLQKEPEYEDAEDQLVAGLV